VKTPDQCAKEFGGILCHKRVQRQMTQQELARACGLQVTHISHFESGRRLPSFGNLITLANALQVSLDELTGRR